MKEAPAASTPKSATKHIVTLNVFLFVCLQKVVSGRVAFDPSRVFREGLKRGLVFEQDSLLGSKHQATNFFYFFFHLHVGRRSLWLVSSLQQLILFSHLFLCHTSWKVEKINECTVQQTMFPLNCSRWNCRCEWLLINFKAIVPRRQATLTTPPPVLLHLSSTCKESVIQANLVFYLDNSI